MIFSIFEQAYSALKHNRRRAALTMLGMAWGIATVVILLAYGAGFERAIMTVFSSFGSNMIAVFPNRTSMQAGGSKAGAEIRFTLEDLDLIANAVPMVKRTSPMVDKQTNVRYDTRMFTFRTAGVYPSWMQIRRMDLAEGRTLTEEDESTHARVVVVGDEVKKKLFSGQVAIGNSIRIDGISFHIIGILKHKVQDGDDNDNRMLIVPFSTMSDLKDTHYLSGIFIEYEGMAYQKVGDAVRQVLAAHHNFKPEDKQAVFVWNLMEDISQFRIVTTGIKILAHLHRIPDSGHRRRRPDEHHARGGHAADTRDWRGKSPGRTQAPHSRAVPLGGDGHHLYRRPTRSGGCLPHLHHHRLSAPIQRVCRRCEGC